MIPEHGVVLVSWDYTHGKDKAIALVGRKTIGHATEVINGFEGEEAIELIKKLIEKKEVK